MGDFGRGTPLKTSDFLKKCSFGRTISRLFRFRSAGWPYVYMATKRWTSAVSVNFQIYKVMVLDTSRNSFFRFQGPYIQYCRRYSSFKRMKKLGNLQKYLYVAN